MSRLELEVNKVEDDTSSGKFGSPQNILWLNKDILKEFKFKVNFFYKIKFEDKETITKIDLKKENSISKLLSQNLNIKPKSKIQIELSLVTFPFLNLKD
jgi:hypothetical protein